MYIMYKLPIILALVGASIAVSSDVAFTSYTDMMNNEPDVLENVIVRNSEPTESTKDCKYIQEWKARYPFKVSHKHEYIYYYVWQCLDDSMSMIRSNVTFNYDGDDNNMHELPEGCVPPSPTTPPKNPCQNGFELGDEVIKNVTQMVTKKLIDHPNNNEDVPELFKGTIHPEELEEVTKSFPELEEKLEEIIEENHASNPENRKPDEVTTNPDGTVTEVYKFPNGDTAEKTETPEGVDVVLTQPDGTKIVTKERPEEPTTVEVYDPNDIMTEKKIIEPNPEDPTEEIVRTYKPPTSDTPSEIIRPRRAPGIPIDVNIPEDLESQFTDVSKKFSATLENYIEESVKCFAEQVINVQESYLTFVCSTTGHSSIRELLEEKFAGEMLCSKLDCDAIQSEIMEQMVDHVNGAGDAPSVTVKKPGSEVTIS